MIFINNWNIYLYFFFSFLLSIYNPHFLQCFSFFIFYHLKVSYMYIGHYGVAFAMKKKFNQIPLWLMFISVQLADFLAFIFILLWIEKIHSVENPNPFYRVVIDYLPYSHSLFSTFIFSLIIFLVFWKIKNKTWGLVLWAWVLSHWFLDLPFQKSNLPIFFDSYQVGFWLWDYISLSFITELVFVSITWYFLYHNNPKIKNMVILILILLTSWFFTFVTFIKDPENIENSSNAKIIILLIAYTIFTIISYFSERKEKINL